MKSRFGCFLICAVIGLFWAGGQKAYTGCTNRTPTSLTAAEYGQTRPPAHWLQLTNCRLMITNGMHRTFKNDSTVRELFIPVRPEGEDIGKLPCTVLLSTKDPGLMLLYQQLQSARSEDEAVGFLQHHKDKVINREIKGLVRYGIDLKEDDRRQLAKLDKTLVSDFIILDDGAEPSMAAGIGMLAGGAVLAGAAFVAVRRSA